MLSSDPMDVFLTPLQSEEHNINDNHQGNPIFDTANKDTLGLKTHSAVEGNENNPSGLEVTIFTY